MKGVLLQLVCWARCASTRVFPALSALVGLAQNILFHIVHFLTLFVPNRPASWTGGRAISPVSRYVSLVGARINVLVFFFLKNPSLASAFCKLQQCRTKELLVEKNQFQEETVQVCIHCNKRLAVLSSPIGMKLTKLFIGGNNLIIPGQGEFCWGRENR